VRSFGLTALILPLLTGCAGFQEALDSRVCYSNGVPQQCDSAHLEFSCEQDIVANVGARDGARGNVSIRLVRDFASPKVGELFSQYCPPNCMPIFDTGESPWQTLQSDVEKIVRHLGYETSQADTTSGNNLELDLTWVDVSSEDPGWTQMKITTRATVTIKVALLTSQGAAVWAGEFSGEDEIRHAYAALSDSETILGNAYCQALMSFSQSIQDIELNPSNLL